jgi:uncharacterized protein YdeI (YjbR/CyaY-like superfamily)
MADTERHVVDVKTAEQWQDWLAGNHDAATEVWLRLFNKNAPEPGMSYNEAVEVALCFGWIDSLARRYDDISRIQRFSPRRPGSAWSTTNVERVHRLIESGQMRDEGLRHVDAAKADGRWPG